MRTSASAGWRLHSLAAASAVYRRRLTSHPAAGWRRRSGAGCGAGYSTIWLAAAIGGYSQAQRRRCLHGACAYSIVSAQSI